MPWLAMNILPSLTLSKSLPTTPALSERNQFLAAGKEGTTQPARPEPRKTNPKTKKQVARFLVILTTIRKQKVVNNVGHFLEIMKQNIANILFILTRIQKQNNRCLTLFETSGHFSKTMTNKKAKFLATLWNLRTNKSRHF